MARNAGRSARLLLALLGLVVAAPLAAFWPMPAAFALAALALGLALLTQGREKSLGERCDTLSKEVDVLSSRLMRLEAQSQAQARTDRADAERAGDHAAGIEEVTVEIGLLSGIVRDLAAVVASQDSEIARLKERPEPAPAPPAPEPVAPPAPAVAPVPAARVAPVAEAIPMPAPVELRPRSVPPLPRQPDRAARFEPPPLTPLAAETPELDEAALLAAFDGEGLEVHLQPVVTLPQRKVFSYEASARLRVAGRVLAPQDFLFLIERTGRSTDLDRRMLQRVSTIARHLAGRGSEAAVAYALSPLSLFEPGFLRMLSRIATAEPVLHGRLLLALPQSSWRSLDSEQTVALKALRGRIGFILDRPTDLRFDALSLAERGVAQAKIPAELILSAAAGIRGIADIAVEDLVAALARAGIRLVATEVERETDVPDLIDLDVPFAQGSVFAPPRAVRAEVLANPPSASAADAPSPDEPEPSAPRRSFRDFLRRAG